ncbi:MAG: diguanylate cyclase domain-containing protein [Anaerovoracaceae bacterium]|jgi:diguanylate cyclase (GGDEF)-like protein
MNTTKKIFISTGIIIALVIVLAFGFFIKSTKDIFSFYYEQQLNNYSSIFRKTLNMARDYTKMYDQSIADDLYYKTYSLNQDLEDTPISTLSQDTLKKYAAKYDFFGLAIFARDDDGIYVYNSTEPEEVGERTKDWGFWDIAFQNLFEGKRPDIEGGFSRHNYWIGPRSKSYYSPDFYRYAYYYNERQDYIINAIYHDSNTYRDNIKNQLHETFEHLYNEISYIEAISLIDIPAWEKAYYNNFKNREAPAFLYGNFDKDMLIQSGITPEDMYAIECNDSFTFKYNGHDKKIFMISSKEEGDKHLIAILLNDHETDAFIQKVLLRVGSLMVFTVVVLLIGILYIVVRYRALLTFQIKRNEEIERFTKNVAMIPEITYKCRIENNEILLTYNRGKSILKDQEISLESEYRPMKDIYSEEYINVFEVQIADVFADNSKRFEITHENEHYEHFASPVFDKDGNVVEIVGIATSITDRRIAEEQAKHFATHDFLTDLINRREFESKAKDRILKEPTNSYAIMIIDLDGFKKVNDTFGHIAGDSVLKQTADRVSNTIARQSSTAMVARLGGDEFAVFLPYENLHEVEGIARSIVADISTPYSVGDELIQLGSSIGISLYNKDSNTYGQLTYYADLAMYHIKKHGGGYQFFSPAMLPPRPFTKTP